MTTTPTRWTTADAGHLIDGARGYQAIAAMIDMAVANGFELGSSDKKAMAGFIKGEATYKSDLGATIDIGDWVLNQGGLADKASDWMNEHLAPEGHVFHWYEGSFYLSPLAEETP